MQVTHSEENAHYGKRILELRDGWLTRDETLQAAIHGGWRTVNHSRTHSNARIRSHVLRLSPQSSCCRSNLALGRRTLRRRNAHACQRPQTNLAAGAGSSSARANSTAAPTSLWRNRCSRQQQPFVCSAAAVSRAHAPLAQPAFALQAQHGASAGSQPTRRALQNLIRDGKIYLSLRDAIAVAIENNLDLAYFRYNFPIAQTDILRTKAGSPANGVNTAIVQSTQGGFAASTGGGGGSSGSGFSAGNGGIVTSTLGAGTTGFVLRSLPHLSGLRRSHRRPGGQPVPGRHAGSENQHD